MSSNDRRTAVRRYGPGRRPIPPIAFVAAILLLLSIIWGFRGPLPTWGDEAFTLRLVNDTGQDFWSEILNDVHPPLYFALARMAGSLSLSDTPPEVRILSYILYLGLIWLTLRLAARRVIERNAMVLPALLIVSSAHLALFGPMLRYYSLAAIGVTSSTLFLLPPLKTLPDDPTRPLIHRAVWYGLLLWIALASSHLALVVVPAHIYYLLTRPKSETRPYWIALACVLFAWLPILQLLILQMRDTSSAVFSGFIPLIIQFVARFAFTIYSFSVGEFIRPWDWWLSIPAILAFCYLVYLAWQIRRTPLGNLLWLILWVSLPLGVLVLTFLGVGIEFCASRLFFLAPIFLLLLALGLSRNGIGHGPAILGHIAVAVLIAVNLFSTFNFSRGTNFIQSTYIIPWARISEDIDLIVDSPDSTLLLYDDPTIVYWLPDRLNDHLETSSLMEMTLDRRHPYAPVRRPETAITVYTPRIVSHDDVRTYVWHIFDSEPVPSRRIEYLHEDETSIRWKSMLLRRQVYEVKKVLIIYNAAG